MHSYIRQRGTSVCPGSSLVALRLPRSTRLRATAVTARRGGARHPAAAREVRGLSQPSQPSQAEAAAAAAQPSQ